MLVVVPAHDEEERVGACLRSILVATSTLLSARPALRVSTTVVLDRCTDRTAAVVAGLDTRLDTRSDAGPDIDVVAVDAACVGTARRVGVTRAARDVPAADHARVLVVNTDADCVVPPSWLLEHVDLAAAYDVVLGAVEPDAGEMTPATLAAWWTEHPAEQGALHGANLAFRLDSYLRVGGFPELSDQEDLLLVRAMRADGAAIVGGTRVTTSGRRDGRVPHGFAGYLRALDRRLAHSGATHAEPRHVAATLPMR